MSTQISAQEVEAYELGEVELRTLLAVDGDWLATLRAHAQALIDMGDDDRALGVLELLVELDRQDEAALAATIAVLLRLGCSDQALMRALAWLSRAPESDEAQLAMAQVQLARGQWRELASTLQQLTSRLGADGDGAARVAHLASEAHAAFERSR